MMEEVVTDNLPEGWMIISVMEPAGQSFDPAYIAYRWTTRIKKRMFRKPRVQIGWVDTGFRSRWLDDTRRWIISTDQAIKREPTETEI